MSSLIENRPPELYDLPMYKGFTDKPFQIDIQSSIGDFLMYDIFDLDGIQPVESKHLSANNGIIRVNPSEESIRLYLESKTKFQFVNVIVNAYDFKEKDGIVYGRPYNISIKPMEKNGQPQVVGVDYIKNIDLEALDQGRMVYHGFNPFTSSYGLFSMGDVPIDEALESDMIGFVFNTYALATVIDYRDITLPYVPSKNKRVVKDYFDYRKKRYFKKFNNNKPRKIWGCDSPIELFLLQALASRGLYPEMQTIFCRDGTIFPHFHTLWENNKARRNIDMITEADFYFPEKQLAIFCDSEAHHSAPLSREKDARISRELEVLGIKSLRIRGREIADSPFTCADKILSYLEGL
ncbi:hypothetical protein EYY94_07740 [Obesumbacterium proteus]|uniref:endonuclease domain-containing protein n=1 Tax=Obesumbacterium proteus TaxID=82983 RepID=UPI0010351960|nr:hypothetical protein [Obesumbacterium proteus]TBL75830.1 hypothetical protein EYY94_07740 [Obesumbacterium proteus]